MSWEKINDLVLRCGSERSPKDMVATFLEDVPALVRYDSARAFLVTDDRIESVVSIGVSRKWIVRYEEFYSSVKGGRYSLFSGDSLRLPGLERRGSCYFIDWSQGLDDIGFLLDYLKPQGIQYVASLNLFDNAGTHWCSLCLERNRLGDFTPQEKDLLVLLCRHLQNLGSAFFTIPRRSWRLPNEQTLSPREREVALLLYRGLTPADIERRLGISRRTVYEHVRHIHKKLGVHNTQELMIAMAQMERRDPSAEQG